EEAPDHISAPLHLKKGSYRIEIHFDQRQPLLKEEACIRPLHTGFQVKYTGPDTHSNLVTIPKDKLFREWKNGTLGNGLDVLSTAAKYLNHHFTSSLRDIRRTYQRAFKAVLFSHRFRLSGKQFHCDHCDLRYNIEKVRKEQPVWFMFHEGLMQVPPTPDQLIRYLNIDINYAPLVLQYFANHIISLTSRDLGDERWTCRVWRGGLWIAQLKKGFH